MTVASSFITFAKQPGVQAMRVTRDELDRAVIEAEKQFKKVPVTPDIPDAVFKQVLNGEGDPVKLRPLFSDEFQDFISDCYDRGERISKITETDVQKFMAGKPVWSEAEIKEKLPEWLRDLSEAFLPEKANELLPRRA